MQIKIVSLALGLAASTFAAAGSMGPSCTPGNVTVPCEEKRWDLGVQALYLKSVYTASKAYLLNTNENDVGEVKNNWDWGYRLEGSYHFNTGNDISINWSHIKNQINQAGFTGSFPLTRPPVSPFSIAGTNRLDQVSLEVGQLVNFGMVDKMRFFGGLQYANIQALSTNSYGITIAPFSSVSLFDNTSFKGFGPVIGMDYAYNLTNSLSLTANSSGSILYGYSRYNSGFVGNPFGLVLLSSFGNKRTMVPGLEAKLGLNYSYSMAQGILNIEGGYQAANYFNALQTIRYDTVVGAVTNSDYGVYGPYFGVKYLGNI